MLKNKKGFTLVELLIVIGILAILIGTVIVAINPVRQFATVRNSQRWSHVSAVLNSFFQNMVDNQGVFTCPAGTVPSTPTYMKVDDGDPLTAEYDICSCIVPTYLAEMPFDPAVAGAHYTDCTDYDSGYQISQDAVTNRITITAPYAELGETIGVTR